MPPFRFGVQLSKADSAAAWRDTARKIEGLGYSTLFIPDHFEDQFGPLVALTVAAEATSTLRVGSLVFGNDYRHPVVLAKEIATLDLFSEGRVEFGLGAGWMTTDYEQSGIAADAAGIRISRMAESLAVMKSLWSTGEATYQGEYFQVTGALGRADAGAATASAHHHRRRRPAGAGHRRPGGGHRRGESEPGRRLHRPRGPRDDHGRVLPAAHRVDQAGGRQAVRRPRAAVPDLPRPDRARPGGGRRPLGRRPVGDLGADRALTGRHDRHHRRDRRDPPWRREEFGFSYIVVHEAEMESFAPVVADLAGT